MIGLFFVKIHAAVTELLYGFQVNLLSMNIIKSTFNGLRHLAFAYGGLDTVEIVNGVESALQKENLKKPLMIGAAVAVTLSAVGSALYYRAKAQKYRAQARMRR